MSKTQPLGFESTLVLMKLGHDMRDALSDTTQATVPDDMLSIADEIPDHDEESRTLVLGSDEYARLGDKPLL